MQITYPKKMTPAGTITKSRKNFPTMSYRAASTMLPIPLASFSPDFKASKVRNQMFVTQFAFILELILPHGFFTVKTFWQQTDSISRKTRRSAALQRTGGLLQLFPLAPVKPILNRFAYGIQHRVFVLLSLFRQHGLSDFLLPQRCHSYGYLQCSSYHSSIAVLITFPS